MRFIRSVDLEPLARVHRGQLTTGRFRVGDWAPVLIPSLHASLRRMRLEFQIVTPAALGFEQGAEWGVIRKAARNQGLEMVPKKLILPLRLRYAEQAVNDFVRIAHEPVMGPGDRPYRFCLHNDGQYLWLFGRETGGDAAVWPGNTRFLFMWDYGEIE